MAEVCNSVTKSSLLAAPRFRCVSNCCRFSSQGATNEYQQKLTKCYTNLSRSSVFQRFQRPEDWREDLQNDPKRGRPSTSRNADAIAKVRCAHRILADELGINKESIRQIIYENLRGKITCEKFVPYKLIMSRNNADSHHGNTCYKFEKTILMFLVTFYLP